MAKAKKKEEEASSEEAKEKPEGEAGAEGEAAEGAPKKGKKKLIIIAGAVVLLLAIVGGLFAAGIIGGGAAKPEDGEHAEAAAEGEGHGEAAEGEHGGGEHGGAPVVKGPTYYELPQFLVNLNSATGKVSFLKMSVTLELKDAAAVAVMDANKPRIVDTFNTYLRELRPADIQGSAGIYRLRTELMTRMNSTIEDGLVKDILFGEIIVQ